MKEWDEFLLNSPRGHHCQLSTWLKSYCVFGMISKYWSLEMRALGRLSVGRVCFILTGESFESRAFQSARSSISAGGRRRAYPSGDARLRSGTGVAALQLHFPCSTECDLPALLPAAKLPDLPRSKAGIAIKYGRADNEMLWIEFPASLDDEAWRDLTFRGLGQHHRREIRKAERNGLEAFEASTETEVREAYSMIEENARLQGYSVRGWRDLGETLIEQVNSRQAIMLVARHRGRNVGANYGALAGKRYTYVLGGITNDGRELKAGFFLQWEAMNKAKRLGFSGYDLASMTNPNVWDFKRGFRPKPVPFVKPRYFVFSQLRYKAFSWVYPKLRGNREPMLKILRAVRNCLKTLSNSKMLWCACVIAATNNLYFQQV